MGVALSGIFARSVAARTGRRRDEPCNARFKNEALLRFSRGNLPRDPAAGVRTAFAVRKSARKAQVKKKYSRRSKSKLKGHVT